MSFLVIGMHRSGTSAITQTIASMGAYVAPAALLLRATPGNPEGFYERTDALAINRGILRLHHCNWHEVQHWQDGPDTLPGWLPRGIASCVDDLQAHAPFVLKDPRLCLTLPYWMPHFPTPPVIVLALRHPAAIADSLLRRNAMPLEQGLALWESYMTYALANIQKLRIIRVSFDAWLADPKTEINALYEQLRQYTQMFNEPDLSLLRPELAQNAPPPVTLSPRQEALWASLVDPNAKTW